MTSAEKPIRRDVFALYSRENTSDVLLLGLLQLHSSTHSSTAHSSQQFKLFLLEVSMNSRVVYYISSNLSSGVQESEKRKREAESHHAGLNSLTA